MVQNRNNYLLIIFSSMLLLFASYIPISFGQNSYWDSSATKIFNEKTLQVPNTVKNFIILIPNEAHESPELPKEQRLINQPYVPQNLVVSPGTGIVWFAGDVGHTRKITLLDESSNKIFNAVLDFNSGSKPVYLNQSGKFFYSESNANQDDPNFVMNGTITVADNNTSESNTNTNSSNGKFQSIAIFMVPTKGIEKYSSTLTDNKIETIDKYSFKDLRETGGGGANQTLIVLGSNEPLDNIISVFEKVTPQLPYS